MKKPLPIGVDNFEDIVQSGYYYVDKRNVGFEGKGEVIHQTQAFWKNIEFKYASVLF